MESYEETIAKTEEQVENLISAYSQKGSDYHAAYFVDLLEKIYTHCPFLILEQWANANLIRVRQGDLQKSLDENHFFQRTEEFLPNPNLEAIVLGRCNRAKQQVFYASFSEEGAQYEALSEFRESDYSDIGTPHVAFFGIWRTNRVLRLANIMKRNGSRKFMEAHHPEWCDISLKMESLIQSAFDEPSDPSVYIFTAEVANYFLKRVDGLVYDSHKTDSEAVNVALRPSLLYDGSMMFEKASRVRRLSYRKDYRKERVDNWIGVPSGEGKLTWHPTLPTLFDLLKRQGKGVTLNEAGKQALLEDYGYLRLSEIDE